ncbi:MAG: GH92 family glycosyl hydrolase, partial [Gammaproteobacteria bacterium]|nr:GH92 family glycosyl hydrolase [Gammaproteobacteria bacterium]
MLTAQDPLQFVDPLIGTDGKGKTYPGATVPYGMVQLSPDNGRTGWDWIAGYFYPDTIIAGFSHTHLSGTGAGDLYDISYMPLRLPLMREKTDGGPADGTLVSKFSHQQEQAQAGYYQVYLPDYQVNVELTAGLRTGYQRYRFDQTTGQNSAPLVRLDLGYSRNWDQTTDSAIRIVDAYTIEGYRFSSGWAAKQKVYFYSRFSQPIKSLQWQRSGEPLQLQTDGQLKNSTFMTAPKQQQGREVALLLQFDAQPAAQSSEITVRTALSSVSSANARQNLLAEGEQLSFDQVKQQAQQAWRQELSQVEVTASRDQLTQFYTALYHSALAPRVFADSDGRFLGPDGEVHQRTDHQHYDFFSLWDTFRALHPWKTLFNPKRNRDQLLSLLDHAEISGLLPVWNFQGNETDMMLGYHAVPVLVDNYLKGNLPPELGGKILQLAVKSAKQQAFGVESYQKLGFVPYAERKWNVALTLEYAYDDWAIARLAQQLGQHDIAAEFSERAQNYRQHFDANTGFMRAKDHNGKFREPFDPNAYYPEDYAEANAWQYSFFVPHDVPGLIALYGGEAAFSQKLDQMFSTKQLTYPLPEWISGYIGQYVHGNEPSHHVPYLYQYAGQPAKTQALVRRIMTELYSTRPDGLAGNEDAGQMSAWYLFSALGFYPVDPVSGQYVLGSPLVQQAKLKLGNGNSLTIKALNQSPEHVYVSAVTLNGQPVTGFTLSHQQLMQGGELI